MYSVRSVQQGVTGGYGRLLPSYSSCGWWEQERIEWVHNNTSYLEDFTLLIIDLWRLHEDDLMTIKFLLR